MVVLDTCIGIALTFSRLKAAMVTEGTMMVCYQPLKNYPNFFRMVTVTSPAASEADMDFVLDELDRLGAKLQV